MKAVPNKLENDFLCLTREYIYSKRKRVELYGRFLKMIDDLQTPLTKPIINTEVVLPFIFYVNLQLR